VQPAGKDEENEQGPAGCTCTPRERYVHPYPKDGAMYKSRKVIEKIANVIQSGDGCML
jgi:hypothetical protein